MADGEVMDLDSAASAIAEILKSQPAEQDINGNSVPDPEPPKPEPVVEQPGDGNTADPGVSAEAQPAEPTAPVVVPEPAKQSIVSPSPDVETKLAEAARTKQEAETARNQYVQALQLVTQRYEAAIKGEFQDINNIDDLQRLYETDPQRYAKYQFSQMRLQQAYGESAKVQQEIQKAEQERVTAWRTEQENNIAKLLPELKDKDKGPALAQRIQAYALEAGYSQAQLSMASANDFKMLHDAMQFRDRANADAAKAEADKKALEAAQAKAANAPPVQKPGTRNTTSKEDKLNTDFERLQKNPNDRNAQAAVFSNFV